ncbi:MAG: protein-L-isoaspartate O-methyltransferase [Nanoarchaeota archaeon]|nr:protein-L-isoaspartate O-methyltransferase [Nanoarchaeota archaeon]
MNKEELLDSLREKGFSKAIIDAFSKVKREDFVPRNVRMMAYEDTALPIGHGQTISQPYTIAVMLSLLDLKKGGGQKVLEIGSGCGYVLALISEIIGENGKVFGVELVKKLAEKSRENLMEFDNAKVYHRSGSLGLPEKAPFDGILISAAIRDIPEKILDQLKNQGILVAPKGSRFEQEIIAIQRKSKTEFEMIKKIPGFIFVPFIE